MQVLCETMKRQIISRAFFGWLEHCRHLRTVRTHLSGLVNDVIITRNDLRGKFFAPYFFSHVDAIAFIYCLLVFSAIFLLSLIF